MRPNVNMQALACLLYQFLAALALAVRTRILVLLAAADEWSGNDGSKRSSKPKRCRLSPPPCDADPAPSSWWRRASLLPPQSPHLHGKLTVRSRYDSFFTCADVMTGDASTVHTLDSDRSASGLSSSVFIVFSREPLCSL
jgi:hypothetical protein